MKKALLLIGVVLLLLAGVFLVVFGPMFLGVKRLVDCGNDPNGKAILAALKARSLGPEAVKAYWVPGHTAGSDDTAQNLAELKKLYARLKAENADVKTLAFAHIGPHQGYEGLQLQGQ